MVNGFEFGILMYCRHVSIEVSTTDLIVRYSQSDVYVAGSMSAAGVSLSNSR